MKKIAIFFIIVQFFAINVYAQRRNVQPQDWIPFIEQTREPSTPLKKIGLVWMDGNQLLTFKDYNGNKQFIGGSNILYNNIYNFAIDGNIIYVDAVNDTIGFFTTSPSASSYIQLSNKLVICKTFTSAGLNACIDALGSTGGTVICPQASYTINSNITIDYSNTSIIGYEAIFELDGNSFHGITANDVSNILIKGIKFDGNNEDTSPSADNLALIYFSDEDGGIGYWKVQDCSFTAYDAWALRFAGTQSKFKISVDNCNFYNATSADSIAIHTGTYYARTFINNCSFANIDMGISCGNSDTSIVGCDFSYNDDYSITGGECNATISGCQFYLNQAESIRNSTNGYFTVTGNTFYANAHYDVYFAAARGIISNNILNGNNYSSNIYIDVADCIIKDNQFIAGTASYCLYLDDDADDTKISGNYFSSDTMDIYIVSGSTGNILYDNHYLHGITNNQGITAFAGYNLYEQSIWTWVDDSLADDDTINLPDAVSGLVSVTITDPNDSFTDEAGAWMVSHDGVSTKISGSTNTANTDSDGNLCVYDGGTYGIVKNRLGDVGEIRIFMFYQ